MGLKRRFDRLGIRGKLLLTHLIIIFVTVAAGNLLIYTTMKRSIEGNIESELQNSTTTILNMVETAAAVSLKNYLRSIAEKNREIVSYYHRQFTEGRLSEPEARTRAGAVLLEQSIGKSGYLYCLNSDGVLEVHPQPALRGVNISEYAFVQEQKRRRQGYLEYDWKNPGERSARPKALYMTYFKPWDWIISVSAYRAEFHELVNVDDFRDSILSLRFGDTGYSYVIDLQGNLIIHPTMAEQNIIASRDADGRFFIREICRRKSGKIIYPWKNPGEEIAREKLVIFNHIPEFGWIVASSSYLDEFFAPLQTLRRIFFLAVFCALVLVLPLVVRLSASITTPINTLMQRFAAGAGGDFSVRMQPRAADEIGRLALYFNDFMERLEAYNADLTAEIRERRQAERRLKLSEEMFQKAFSSSPHAIAICRRADARFINVNDRFLDFTGYAREEVMTRTFLEFSLMPEAVEAALSARSGAGSNRMQGVEIAVVTRSGAVRSGVISAEVIDLWGEACLLLNIVDITEVKRMEKALIEIGEKERRRIGQDLHDDLCPQLIGIEVLMKVLIRRIEGLSPEEGALAEQIRVLIKEAIGKARNLSRVLLPVYLVDHGLPSAIQELVRHAEAVYGIPVRLECEEGIRINDHAAATHLFYIIQEALNNALRHARATRITIALRAENGRVHAAVSDDGIGYEETSDAAGMGLRIMGYRAGRISGRLSIARNETGGTTVRVTAGMPDSGGEEQV